MILGTTIHEQSHYINNTRKAALGFVLMNLKQNTAPGVLLLPWQKGSIDSESDWFGVDSILPDAFQVLARVSFAFPNTSILHLWANSTNSVVTWDLLVDCSKQVSQYKIPVRLAQTTFWRHARLELFRLCEQWIPCSFQDKKGKRKRKWVRKEKKSKWTNHRISLFLPKYNKKFINDRKNATYFHEIFEAKRKISIFALGDWYLNISTHPMQSRMPWKFLCEMYTRFGQTRGLCLP